MLTATHIRIGNYIYHRLKNEYGLYLSKKSLIYGSVKPDFMKNKVPHYIDKSINYIEKEIEILLSQSMDKKEFSRRLGMIIHYISDYFCRAHNTSYYKNNIIAHLKYERRLSKEMTMKNIKAIKNNEIKFDVVKEFIINFNEEYMKHKSLKRDNEYTVTAINSICSYIAEKLTIKLEKKVA